MKPVVAVLAFEGISSFHLSVPCAIFGDICKSFELKVFSESSSIRCSSGFTMTTNHNLGVLTQADIIIIPSWYAPFQPPSIHLAKALSDAHQRGAMLVSLCLGTYVLAAAGLLSGRKATTHWAYAEDFRHRFPDINLNPDVLYVDDGEIISSAGTAAGIDCCLHIIRQRLGIQEANRIARIMVVPPQRSGGQAQFIELPVTNRVSDQRIATVMDHVREHLRHKHSLDSLADQAMMHRRSFTRRFKRLTGLSVNEWLIEERLRYCQQLLESSSLSIEQVADQAGFGSVVTLRHHFRTRFGISPSEWRKMFILSLC